MMNETAAVSKVNVRKITVTAMLGALAAILIQRAVYHAGIH